MSVPISCLRIMPPRARRWVEAFNCLLAIGFSAGLVWYGWQIVDTALLIDEHSSTDLQFPMWVYYLALPTGAGLMAARYLIRLARHVFFYDPAMAVFAHAAHEILDGRGNAACPFPDARRSLEPDAMRWFQRAHSISLF